MPAPKKDTILSDLFVGLKRFSNAVRWKEFFLNQPKEIEKSSLKKDRYSTYDDQFQWFLFPGLLLLFLDFLMFERLQGSVARRLLPLQFPKLAKNF